MRLDHSAGTWGPSVDDGPDDPSGRDRLRRSSAGGPLRLHPTVALEGVALLIRACLEAVETHLRVDGVSVGREPAGGHQLAQQLRRVNLLLEEVGVGEAVGDGQRRPAAGVADIELRALVRQVLRRPR